MIRACLLALLAPLALADTFRDPSAVILNVKHTLGRAKQTYYMLGRSLARSLRHNPTCMNIRLGAIPTRPCAPL